MDDSRFDALAHSLTTAGSRRRTLGGLLLGSLGLLGSRAEKTEAHDPSAGCKKKSGKSKKKCLKKAKKHAATHTTETAPPGCTPTCAGKQCGPNGCGGSCGSCSTDPLQPEVCDPEGQCFLRGGSESGGDPGACCSGQPSNGQCIGRPGGEDCTFDAACETDTCLDGKCAS